MATDGESPAILIVCTGNVCRSPFIERLLIRDVDRTYVRVSSRGTRALVGQDMDPRVAGVLAAHGADPLGFRARQLDRATVADASLILTAERAHRSYVVSLHPPALKYTFALADFADLVNDLHVSSGVGLEALVSSAAARRGLVPSRARLAADVVDPYRRGKRVLDDMVQQVMDDLPKVTRAVRLGIGVESG